MEVCSGTLYLFFFVNLKAKVVNVDRGRFVLSIDNYFILILFCMHACKLASPYFSQDLILRVLLNVILYL